MNKPSLFRVFSSRSEAIKLCPKGKLRKSFSIIVSLDREKREGRRWTILSSGSMSTIVRTLFGKWLWDELQVEEFEFFISLRGVLSDPTISSSLTARGRGLPKKVIREKLLELKQLGILNVPDHQQYKSLIGQSFIFLIKEKFTLRKTQKFSGYTRHHKDKGSLGTNRVDETATEFEETQIKMEEFIINYLLSVYGLPMFQGKAVLTMDSKKNRNGIKINAKNREWYDS